MNTEIVIVDKNTLQIVHIGTVERETYTRQQLQFANETYTGTFAEIGVKLSKKGYEIFKRNQLWCAMDFMEEVFTAETVFTSTPNEIKQQFIEKAPFVEHFVIEWEEKDILFSSLPQYSYVIGDTTYKNEVEAFNELIEKEWTAEQLRELRWFIDSREPIFTIINGHQISKLNLQ